jgi:hypothetical protein
MQPTDEVTHDFFNFNMPPLQMLQELYKTFEIRANMDGGRSRFCSKLQAQVLYCCTVADPKF